MPRELPMFPLGNLLFPYGVVPLHVFEPRYVALVEAMVDGSIEPEFGTVLIERGSEVGGGDVRFGVGTLARVVRAAKIPSDRYVIENVGIGRIRIIDWLPDDPYPRALVNDAIDTVAPDADAQRDQAVVALRKLLALAVELGISADATVAIDPEPLRASYEIAAVAPLGPLDAQRLLELDDAADRLRELCTVLDDQRELFAARLASGEDATDD